MIARQAMENDLVSLFDNFGMGTTIWSPLAGGNLTGKYINAIPEKSRGNEGVGFIRKTKEEEVVLMKSLFKFDD